MSNTFCQIFQNLIVNSGRNLVFKHYLPFFWQKVKWKHFLSTNSCRKSMNLLFFVQFLPKSHTRLFLPKFQTFCRIFCPSRSSKQLGICGKRCIIISICSLLSSMMLFSSCYGFLLVWRIIVSSYSVYCSLVLFLLYKLVFDVKRTQLEWCSV
jgi:hypothetical protein